MLLANLTSIEAEAVMQVTLLGSQIGHNYVAHNNNFIKGWT